MFAALIPLILSLAPQLASMIFGSKGADATARVAGVVQTVVGAAGDLSTAPGVAAAVAHIRADQQASLDLSAKLADLHLQMQKEQDAADASVRQDALADLKARFASVASARDMAADLARSHSGMAYGSMVISIVIVASFGWTTYAILTNHLSTADGQFGSVLVGTLAAMATQVANYWLGSSLGSSTKNVLLANAQSQLAASVPSSMLTSTNKS